MNKTDELLNKYIDGELQAGELEEIQLLLKLEENVKRLKALKMVDSSLRTLESELAPKDFTSKFMNTLSVYSSKVKLSKNHFALTINVIFVVSLLAILVFVFSQVNLNFSKSGIESKLNDTLNTFKESMVPFLTFFKNKSVMFFGSSFSLILLLGAYYFVEGHNTFKKRIENLTSK